MKVKILRRYRHISFSITFDIQWLNKEFQKVILVSIIHIFIMLFQSFFRSKEKPFERLHANESSRSLPEQKA